MNKPIIEQLVDTGFGATPLDIVGMWCCYIHVNESLLYLQRDGTWKQMAYWFRTSEEAQAHLLEFGTPVHPFANR